MKKVKIMLLSVWVLAVVAGVFAFKAKKSLICIYTTTETINPTSAICTLVTDAWFAPPGQTEFTTTCYYASTTGPCTTTLTAVPCAKNTNDSLIVRTCQIGNVE